MGKSIKQLTTMVIVIAVTFTSAFITPPARAGALTTSEAGITFIKNYEGFRSHVYWDSGSAFIGYGTICRSTDYPNGISQEKADALMREALKAKENTVNKVLSKYSVQLTQNQFDAILSFTYNLGTGWMSTDTRLFSYMISGLSNYSDIQIVNAIATWCHAGKSVSSLLVERRLDEAKIFLYGDYDGSDPHSYRYLTFDAGKGSVENSIVFFLYGTAYGQFQTATLDGQTFAGWVTKSGDYITAATIVQNNLAVTAVWTDGTQPVQAVQNISFPDVTENDWYYTYVKDLSASSIITGLPDGSFHPGNTVTYGEALKLVLLTVGFAEQAPTDSQWASGYLKLAVSKGIVASGEVSDLNAPITRLQVAQITAKAVGLPELPSETTFSDTTDGFVLALYHCGIVSGKAENGTLTYNPSNSITRAEISAILWKVVHSNVIPY